MRSVNKVILLGNVGKTPEIISTSGGTLVASFSIATGYTVPAKQEGGTATQVTEWHRVKAFKRTAEIVRDYVSKGMAVYVEGTLQTRSWDKDGEKRYSTEIIVHELSLLGAKKEGGVKPDEAEAKIAAATAAAEGGAKRGAALEDGTYISDSDIPF